MFCFLNDSVNDLIPKYFSSCEKAVKNSLMQTNRDVYVFSIPDFIPLSLKMALVLNFLTMRKLSSCLVVKQSINKT